MSVYSRKLKTAAFDERKHGVASYDTDQVSEVFHIVIARYAQPLILQRISTFTEFRK